MVRDMTRQVEGGLNSMVGRWMGAVVLAGLVASGAWGQGSSAASGADATAKAPEVLLPGATFDVATIKPADPNASGSSIGASESGSFFSKNETLKEAICNAYGRQMFQCLGGPAWLDADRYDIEAKPDSATAEQLIKLSRKERDAVRHRMQQALFADRLKLKTHFETRDIPVLALVVAKGGLKMQQAKPGDTYASGLKGDDGKPYGKGVFSMGYGSAVGQGTSLDNLVLNLPGITGHFVANETGLTGVYDFTLHYSPVDPPPPDSNEPSIYTALEEQLGLKLESVKRPMKVVVIDSVERPSEN